MKEKSLHTVLLAFVTAFLVHSAPAASSTGAPVGGAKVVQIMGRATYQDASGQSGDLKVGQIVMEGASISSSKDSTVELSFGGNGGSLTIKPDSTVAIEQLGVSGSGSEVVVNTRLNLTKGGLNGNVKKLAAHSKYEIKTIAGVAAIRGTSYSILASGIAHVWQGSLNIVFFVGGVASQPFLVLEGQTVYPPATPGGIPTLGPLPEEMNRPDTTIVTEPEPRGRPNTTTFDKIVKKKNNSPR